MSDEPILDYPYYRGDAKTPSATKARVLRTARLSRHEDVSGYKADPMLVKAVNVSLLLGQPLLLTGEPGTGKTQLAYSLADELGFGDPLKFATKSTSTATDLFYTFNVLSRFNAAYAEKGSEKGQEFITYNALGLAILLANTVDEIRAKRLVYEPVSDLPPSSTLQLDKFGKVIHEKTRRSVVLIDEIDKAPRDFPNDLLSEIEEMSFRIPELDNAYVSADPSFRPIVVITSNSEKNLPDAFLRRCVYYDIPFPDARKLKAIVESRLGPVDASEPPLDSSFVDDAITVLERLREPRSGLRKKPATAELLGWMLALRKIAGPAVANPLRGGDELVLGTVNVLIKTAIDQIHATNLVESWLKSTKTTAEPTPA